MVQDGSGSFVLIASFIFIPHFVLLKCNALNDLSVAGPIEYHLIREWCDEKTPENCPQWSNRPHPHVVGKISILLGNISFGGDFIHRIQLDSKVLWTSLRQNYQLIVVDIPYS